MMNFGAEEDGMNMAWKRKPGEILGHNTKFAEFSLRRAMAVAKRN